MAISHKFIQLIHRLLSRKEPYKDLGNVFLHEKTFKVAKLTRRLRAFGYCVSHEPISDGVLIS